MAAPNYKDLVARTREHLPGEQSIRDLLFSQRQQNLQADRINNPSVNYMGNTYAS